MSSLVPTHARRLAVSTGLALLLVGAPAAAQPGATVPPAPTAHPSPASSGGATMVLSEGRAVAMALRGHPAIDAAKRKIESAEWRTSQTTTAWLPRLGGEVSYMYVGPLQELTIDTGLTPPGAPGPLTITQQVGSLNNFAAGLTAGWRVLEWGGRVVRTQAAQALERAARAEADEQRAQIAFAVRASYLAARFFQEMEATTAKTLELARDELSQEQAKRTAGIGSTLDTARIDMRVAELQGQLTRARQERQRTLATLRLLIGARPSVVLVLSDELQQLAHAPLPARAGGRGHPTRRRVRAMYDAAEREHARLWRGYLPTLDAVGMLEYRYPVNPFTSDEGGVIYSAGAVLRWNIFDGDLTRRKRRGAEAQMAELVARDRAVEREVARKLADARAKLGTAEAAAEAASRVLQTAETYRRAAAASLDAGVGTELELRKATERADQARLAVLKAYFDGAMARAEYLAAAGRAQPAARPRRQSS